MQSDKDTFIIQINYLNSCVSCLSPVQSFYSLQKRKGNVVLLRALNLNEQFVLEYLQDCTGIDDLGPQDVVSSSLCSKLDIKPTREHTVFYIKNGQINYLQTCVSFFEELEKKRLNPVVDSFRVEQDLSGLKYEGLYTMKITSQKFLLVNIGYYENVLLYNRSDKSIINIDQLNKDFNLVSKAYSVYFNSEAAKKSLLLRNASITKEGKLGSRKELSMINVKTLMGITHITYRMNLAFPDSSTKSTTLIVRYSEDFKIENYWLEMEKPALGHYYISLSYGDKYVLNGNQALLPVYYSGETFPDPAYNLAEYFLKDNHTIVFSKLLSFFEPAEKQKILGTKSYNFFSERSMFMNGDTLEVIYSIMPFVYRAENKIHDTLVTASRVFDDPNFKALIDSIQKRSTTFSMPYFSIISPTEHGYLSVVHEFGNKYVTYYTKGFMQIGRLQINDPTNEIFPGIYGNKLVYLRRWPKINGAIYIYEVDLGIE